MLQQGRVAPTQIVCTDVTHEGFGDHWLRELALSSVARLNALKPGEL